MTTHKQREDRVRRALAKSGFVLKKTPARSWLRKHYGPGYMIMTLHNTIVCGYEPHAYSATLEQVENFAFSQKSERLA